jgi:hypothetical protein
MLAGSQPVVLLFVDGAEETKLGREAPVPLADQLLPFRVVGLVRRAVFEAVILADFLEAERF